MSTSVRLVHSGTGFPPSIDDVARVIKFCRRHDIGHSLYVVGNRVGIALDHLPDNSWPLTMMEGLMLDTEHTLHADGRTTDLEGNTL